MKNRANLRFTVAASSLDKAEGKIFWNGVRQTFLIFSMPFLFSASPPSPSRLVAPPNSLGSARLDPPYTVRALPSPSQDDSLEIKNNGYLGVMMNRSGLFNPRTQLIDALIESYGREQFWD